jgi:hypothetical protein
MDTNNLLLIVGAVVALALVVFLGVSVWRNAPSKRRARLRERFGPEYDFAVQQHGEAEAERILTARTRRVQKLDLRSLSKAQCADFSAAWRRTQERFVDRPSAAVSEAHDLVQQVMRARGYPVEDFDQRIADLSVDYGGIVQHYRAAHDLDESNRAGRANTEELRQAMVHYRALFAELLGTRPAEEAAPPSRPVLSHTT